MGLNARAQRRLADALERAAAAGHDVNRLVTIPPGTPGTQRGTMAVCSCGWTSTPRARRVIAATAATFHALEVCEVLDERKRLDGVEWTAAPSTPRLHRLGAEGARHAAQDPASPELSDPS